MSPDPSTRFELHGVFAGFFRDVFGKRRMVLRVAGEEVDLKVPKALRHELENRLHAGQPITVAGTENGESEDDRQRRIVTGVKIAGDPEWVAASAGCTLRVCAKKRCWRNGGRELWHALEEELESSGRLRDRVKLKAVECLGHCKRGPNVEAGGREFHHCSRRDAHRILGHVCPHETAPAPGRRDADLDPCNRQKSSVGKSAASVMVR